ncbi:MAG TPA: GatB/YqeY domain-containing protein [Blastocatellia bacterium]|nr:GatB/YqeY domain-containing protein [Blastocatellia bacterium]
MALQERIHNDMIAALKAKDELRLSTLRLIKAALKNREVSLMRPLDDAGVIEVLKSLIKQRRESVEQYRAGGRTDLAEKEEKEIAIIEEYLPAAMSDAELERIVAETIAELGATTLKDMGRVMKAVMAKLEGQLFDGKVVNQMVRTKLSQGG